MAYDLNDFQTDVLEASQTAPVLVDFWAPWCGPCRVLGPVLEKLAAEANGAWTLVKINSDERQDLSVQYGVRGIPAVKLFSGGQVVDEFTGALPEYAVRQWLEKAIPSEERALLGRAESALDDGDVPEATSLLEQVLASEPGNPQASALLARAVVFTDPARAAGLADTGMNAEPRHVQVSSAVRSVADALTGSESLPEGAGSESFSGAVAALRQSNFDEALLKLIEVLQANRYYHDDAARKLGVALFTLLGDQHVVTKTHRRTFDMWLY